MSRYSNPSLSGIVSFALSVFKATMIPLLITCDRDIPAPLISAAFIQSIQLITSFGLSLNLSTNPTLLFIATLLSSTSISYLHLTQYYNTVMYVCQCVTCVMCVACVTCVHPAYPHSALY